MKPSLQKKKKKEKKLSKIKFDLLCTNSSYHNFQQNFHKVVAQGSNGTCSATFCISLVYCWGLFTYILHVNIFIILIFTSTLIESIYQQTLQKK